MLTRVAKVQPNPISFCMGHGAYKSSCIGPSAALQELSGPRYRPFSGTTLAEQAGTRDEFQQVAV